MTKPTEHTERQRSALLLPLVAVTVLFLLGVFFFVIGQDRNASPQASDTNRTEANTSTPTDPDIIAFEKAVTQYAQLLVEASRESAAGQSAEAAGVQEVLQEQTAIVARSLSGNVATKDGKTVSTEQIAEVLEQFNASIIEYGTLARAGLVDDTKVNAAIEDLNEVLNGKSGQDKARIQDALISFKNDITESIRSFAQERHVESYQKQLESQDAARELFTLIRS